MSQHLLTQQYFRDSSNSSIQAADVQQGGGGEGRGGSGGTAAVYSNSDPNEDKEPTDKYPRKRYVFSGRKDL